MFRLLLICFVSRAWVSAQEPIYTLKVDVPIVSLDVTVTDAAGNTINSLSQADFQILENGIPQEIRYFGPTSAAYNIFLLFDRSGSTRHKWLFMQKAVAGFLSNLKPQDRVSIATFDEELDILTKWNDPRTRSLHALTELIRPAEIGRTDFYRSLERVLRREFRDIPARRTVVVLTDGRDTSTYRHLAMTNRLLDAAEDREYQRALRAAQEQRIPTHFIAINTDRNFEPNMQGGDEFRNLQIIFPNSETPRQYLTQVRLRMEDISQISGGRMLYPNSIDDIVPLYEQIARELGTAYSLGFAPAERTTGAGYRRIEVKVKDSTLQVKQSRTGYYAR